MMKSLVKKIAVYALLLLFSVSIIAQDGFRVWPYLQHPAPDAMSIHWFSETEIPGILYWSTEGGGSENSRISVPVVAEALGYPHWEDAAFFGGDAPPAPYSHTIRLESLEPGTIYQYRVIQASDTFTSTFQTAPSGNDSIRFIVYSDCETEPESTGKPTTWTNPVDGSSRLYLVDQTTGYRNNLTVIRSRHPDLVLIAGDIAQHGGEQRDWDEFWKHNTGPDTSVSLAGQVPLLATPGNHDYYEGPQMDGYNQPGSERAINKYLTYFETPPNNSPDPSQEGRYYSYSYGPVSFIVLDACNQSPNGSTDDTNFYLLGENDSAGGHAPDFGPGSRQYSWLEEQLSIAQATSLFTFVMFHHIPYSSGPHGYPPGSGVGEDNQSGQPTRVLTPLFMKYGVDAVFCGHDEMWERSEVTGHELLPGGTEVDHSLEVFDVGTGGDGLRGPYEGTSNTWQQFLVHTDVPEVWENGILVSGGKHYGHLEVDVRPVDANTWQAILTPVHIFPLYNETDGAYTDFERRLYDDIVILTSETADSTLSHGQLQGSIISSKSYPNPFTGSSVIEFGLNVAGTAEITIFDSVGRLMRIIDKRYFSAGTHTVTWNGKDSQDQRVAPGLYYYRIRNGDDGLLSGKIVCSRTTGY